MNYKQAYKSEGYGSDFDFGIEINLAAPITESESIRTATRKAVDLIEQEVTREFHKNNEKSQERAKRERAELLNCFPETPIFVKEIPNGYCSRACCEHLKWFLVATRIGFVKIGWRKSVIAIDWSDTEIRKILSDDDVTKDETMIHAWSYEKASEYLGELLKS